MGRNDPGGSRHAQNSTVAMEKLKNQGPKIEVQPIPYCSTRCPYSNSVNETQIQVHMLKL